MSESIKELLAREAAEAEARAEAEEAGEVGPSPGQRGRRRADDPSQVYAVRIPVSLLNELRQVADRLDAPPSALMRQWVLERLDVERRTQDEHRAAPSAVGIRPGLHLGPSRRQRSDEVERIARHA